jgi:cyanophycin synthetase
VEVNAGPGLLMHIRPAEGKPRPVGAAIVEHLFPVGESGRIPIIGITGHDDTGLLAHLVTQLLQSTDHCVGSATRHGLVIGERLARRSPANDWDSAHKLLLNRAIDMAVIENSPRQIAEVGLAYDRCLVGVVTSLDTTQSMDDLHIVTPKQLFGVLRCQVDVVLREGASVLNADDPQVAEMADLSDGQVIFYGQDARSPVIQEHLNHGRRAVIASGEHAILAVGREQTRLDGLLGAAPAAAMLPAIAVAWSMGFTPEQTRTVLMASTRPSTPSRAPAKVIAEPAL